jgi:hypothetical protein
MSGLNVERTMADTIGEMYASDGKIAVANELEQAQKDLQSERQRNEALRKTISELRKKIQNIRRLTE